MEDDFNTLKHRVDSRSACDFRHEACDFHPKGMRLIENTQNRTKKRIVWT